jgi:hypothetical protein
MNCITKIVTGIFSVHLSAVAIYIQENNMGHIPPDKAFPGTDVSIAHLAVVDETFRLQKKIARPYPHFLENVTQNNLQLQIELN